MCIRDTYFQKQMSAYKFQVFITIGINLLSLSKLLYDTTEIDNTLNLINIFFNFVQNNFNWVNNVYFVSKEYTPLNLLKVRQCSS